MPDYPMESARLLNVECQISMSNWRDCFLQLLKAVISAGRIVCSKVYLYIKMHIDAINFLCSITCDSKLFLLKKT